MPTQIKPIYPFLLFWHLTSITQLIIALSGSATFEGLNYDGYLDYESIISKSFIEDTILVGDPYGKRLRVLAGTVDTKTSHHGEHD